MLRGLDYTVSAEKYALDERCADLLRLPAECVEAGTKRLLARDLVAGADPYFVQERQLNSQAVVQLAKLTTMHALTANGQADAELSYSKNNPRIVSGTARIARDLAFDELAQLRLVPEMLSMVGIRPLPLPVLEAYLDQASKIDSGVARDFASLHDSPDVRPGLTGPSQLRWLWTDERSPQLIATCMRTDVQYYYEEASFAGDMKIIAMTSPALVSSCLWKAASRRRQQRRAPNPA